MKYYRNNIENVIILKYNMNIILFLKKFTIKFTISKSLLMLSLLLCHACATLLLLYNV